MREELPRPGDRLSLGRELKVSPFCLGVTMRPEVVPAAFEAGINFFFVSADLHWPVYEPMRRGLEMLFERGGGIRDDIVVAGVSYATQPVFCFAPFQELLASVRGLDRLDVLVAGGAYGPEIAARRPVYVQHRVHAFCGARAIGVSFHDRAAAAIELNRGDADLCFARYNVVHPGARNDLFPHISQRRALLYNFNNTRGWVPPARIEELGVDPEAWRPQVTDHFRYVLTPPEVDGMLCRLDIEEHVRELVDALPEGPLTPDEVEHMEVLAELARQ